VRYSDGTFEVHVMDRLTIPLNESDAMDGYTREQTRVIAGVLPT
jgi:hypothetical protein